MTNRELALATPASSAAAARARARRRMTPACGQTRARRCCQGARANKYHHFTVLLTVAEGRDEWWTARARSTSRDSLHSSSTGAESVSVLKSVKKVEPAGRSHPRASPSETQQVGRRRNPPKSSHKKLSPRADTPGERTQCRVALAGHRDSSERRSTSAVKQLRSGSKGRNPDNIGVGMRTDMPKLSFSAKGKDIGSTAVVQTS